jgi:hypothetical protein
VHAYVSMCVFCMKETGCGAMFIQVCVGLHVCMYVCVCKCMCMCWRLSETRKMTVEKLDAGICIYIYI